MPTKTIRVKMCGGRLEPLDEFSLPDGSETTVTLTVPDPVRVVTPSPVFRTWNLGLG
jgi:hypothetical protein